MPNCWTELSENFGVKNVIDVCCYWNYSIQQHRKRILAATSQVFKAVVSSKLVSYIISYNIEIDILYIKWVFWFLSKLSCPMSVPILESRSYDNYNNMSSELVLMILHDSSGILSFLLINLMMEMEKLLSCYNIVSLIMAFGDEQHQLQLQFSFLCVYFQKIGYKLSIITVKEQKLSRNN